MKYIYLIFIISFTYIGVSAQDILMQDGTFNQCSGTFYDSGGPAGDFAANENFILTICPDGPDLETILEFTFFEMSVNHEMIIYNADNASDPTTILGTFTGLLTNNPGLNIIGATNPTGCLTVEFIAETFPIPPLTGWEATIGCRPPCQTITPSIQSIEPTCGDNDLIPVNQPVSFSGNAITSSGDTNDLTYEWDFDGDTFNGQNVTTSFPSSGTINALLTVTDSFGCFGVLEFELNLGTDLMSVDDTTFSLDQLVSEVLIQGECADVDNIISPLSAQASNAGYDSYGYFNRECSGFPFEEGIVLASEGVSAIPTGFPIENGFGPGDPDLTALGGGNTNDATVIEFEFTPYVDEISFNYIFASREYDPNFNFPCSFADTFAFILSGPGISNVNDYNHDANPSTPDLSLDLGGLNIALIPGTNVPVSATNIHNISCGSGLGEFAFPEFFDVENFPPGYHKYDGQVVELTAQADVIPGETYTIKLAISDFSDSVLNSAVFIEGGSFNLGADIGEDLVLEDVTALCEGDTQILQVFEGLAPPGFNFVWSKDGVPIPGETGPTLEVTETGEYCIELEAGVDCNSSDCTVVEFIPIFKESEDITEDLSLNVCEPFNSSATFDLTLNNVRVSENISNEFFNDFPNFQDENQGVEPYVVTYFENELDAQNRLNPILSPQNFPVDPANLPLTIFYSVEDNFNLGCFDSINSVGSFELSTTETLVGPLENFTSCGDDPGENFAFFNLTQNNTNALNGENSLDFEVIYYTSEENAIDGINPILNSDNFENTTNPQTIWTKLVNLENDLCFSIASFEIAVDVSPEITIPAQDLSECGDFTLTQLLDLTQNDLDALGVANPADFQLNYFNTQADADADTNPIADPITYLPSNITEDIFIRIENITAQDCFVTTSFSVNIFDVEIFQPDNLESCDDGTGTETAIFDLTQQNATIFGPNQNSTTHSISYHTSQPDAEGGFAPIANPDVYSNTSNPETIWARVQTIGDPSCFEVISFEILVTDSAPVNTNVGPLVACDDDNDGFFNNFDLISIAAQISLGNPDVVVSFHLTPSDAENGVGEVDSPYASVVEDQQTLYFRTLDTNNGCEQFGELLLQVFDSPLLTPIEEPLIGCDDDGDELLFFDLTQVEAEVLGDLDPTTLEISYHISLSDAQDGINPIPDPENYQNATNPQTIWVRVTDPNSPVGCFDIEAFDIIVEPTPDIVNPEPLEVCDDSDSGDLSDEIATFDLNEKINEITQGNNELLVEFYESQLDLDNDNPITPIDAYTNITNPQTLEVKVTSSTNGCSSFTTLTLVVNPVPSLALELEPLEICDPDNDGFAEFDLEAAIVDILNNEPDVTISFHLTLADAELGVNPIDTSNPFGTSNPGQQTIYVRAENTGPNGDDGTGCFDTRPLDLIVIPSPEIIELEDLSRCDDDSANGFVSFDLTVNTPLALGEQQATDLLVTYHETQTDAEQGINPIAVPSNYTNITNPQIIYVRIENTVTGCIDLYNSSNDVNNTFTLTVEALPIVNIPSILEVCDDDDNQDPFPQTTFDLTIKEPEIIDQPIVPANLQFTYYASQTDFDNDNPIEDPTAYVNSSQPQSVIVSVVDTATENACSDSTVLTISVLPLPSPSETDPDVLRLQGCDDDNDGVANQPFDLTQSGILIAGSETVELSYYTSEELALVGDVDDQIADPTTYVNDPALNLIDEDGNPTSIQIIYVRVDNAVAGNFCFVIVPIELQVNQAPVLNPLGDPFAYTLCEDDNAIPGEAMLFSMSDITNNLYDFTNGSSDVIIPLLDPNVLPPQNIDDFTVTYHFLEEDAENGVNAISPGTTVSDGDILFIRVVNPETLCFNINAIGRVQIVIQPRPDIALDDPEDIVICADDINIPEIGTIDLTQQDEAINPGLPPNTTVIYYAGMMNYNDGISIEDPTAFTTTQSPQTIIAEVINTNTLCESSSFVSFDIIVNQLPNVDISGFDGAVVCFDSTGALIFNEVSPPTIDTGLSDEVYDFVWTLNAAPLPGETSPSLTAVTAGTYTVTVTDMQTGCEASSSATIIEGNPPEFQVSILTPSFSGTHVVEVNSITGTGDFEFRLDDGEWIALAPGQQTLIFNNVAPGIHVITGRDSGGCGEIQVSFNLIDYPPFFTPNQDGFNDRWNITSLSEQPNAKIYIFDRYGKLLKQISPTAEGWDGTYNGNNMPAQDYWFRVEFTEPQTQIPNTFKAHFTLKR